MTQPSKFQQRIAAEKARLETERQASSVTPVAPVVDTEKYASVIPEPDYEPDPFDVVLKDLDILKAYKLWCGKMTPTQRKGQTESIMISCPKPSHRDSNPSAWVNTALNTWYCGTCQEGGDPYDIAAMHFQIDSYKSGRNFGKLRELMANDLGYGVAKIGKKDVPYLRSVPDLAPSEPEATDIAPPQASAPAMPITAETDASFDHSSIDPATVGPVGVPELPVGVQPIEDYEREIAEVIALDNNQIIFPTLDWRPLVKPGSFLDYYMAATIVDDIAEEYHFWNGLLALGLASGRDAHLVDSPNVYGNLFVCLLGLTGDGKSRSLRYLRTVLQDALPFDNSVDYPKGSSPMPTPSSAEALIQMFTSPIYDPINPKLIVDYAPIRGLVEFAELSELASKASRMGNTLKPTLIEFYDMKKFVSTISVTNGVKKAQEPYCSVFSSTQPNSLKEVVGKTDKTSGFLNRWVFVSGKAKDRSFFQSDLVDMSDASEALKRVHAWVGFGKEMKVDDDAITVMEAFYKDTLEPLIQREDSGMLSRLPLLYKKLLLLFAINEQTDIITGEIASKVVSMHTYQTEAFQLPSASIGSDDLTVCYNDVIYQVERLTKGNGVGTTGPSIGYLKKVLKRKDYSIKMISDSLKIAENFGEVEVYAGDSSQGRPTTRYRWVAHD